MVVATLTGVSFESMPYNGWVISTVGITMFSRKEGFESISANGLR